ncbi:hypothetical protein [uncultured Fibrella sp.]|uniref:hypothetical protein n=1 Tax=uncultured Fibrella sp. TaxID=1284596 RepID=UPI0035CADDCF
MAQNSASSDLPTDTFPVGNTASSVRPNLPANLKKRLGVSAAALLLGGGAALAFMPKDADEPQPQPDDHAGNEPPVAVVPPNADVATRVNDGMSFGNAFSTARDEVGLGGVFMWRNQAYNTFLKEEWAGLSLQQRQEYAEHVLDVGLPIAVQQPVTRHTDAAVAPMSTQAVDPTIIEGHLGDRRVMGIDQDNDGVIDMLVIEGEDGYTYTVADASGDQGLDTMYVYEALKDDYVLAARLDQPIRLTNDDFSAELEDAMSKEAVAAIMADYSDAPVSEEETADDDTAADDDSDDEGPDSSTSESYEENGYGDTYVNNAPVDDMDDTHQ